MFPRRLPELDRQVQLAQTNRQRLGLRVVARRWVVERNGDIERIRERCAD